MCKWGSIALIRGGGVGILIFFHVGLLISWHLKLVSTLPCALLWAGLGNSQLKVSKILKLFKRSHSIDWGNC